MLLLLTLKGLGIIHLLTHITNFGVTLSEGASNLLQGDSNQREKTSGRVW